MSTNPNGNIFFTRENLVLSLPLITLCTSYAYFKFIPLDIGLPILSGLYILYKIYSSLRYRAIEKKEQKIANLDEALLKELAADEFEEEEKNTKKNVKKQNQKTEKARQRLAAGKKANKK
uniref:Uncharacterized protein n=1 Tax=Eucampia antarctica TaxID=49252 RepID=A0A7S2R948_9STRA|mmetsp:Transcript_18969/g.18238  ORF Transcript_18969/g.18238 Transcript_18969/m.18238 type:complete len:120 (+) Transcript_18969:65-424(+)|eukprot:CAMPEP_0197831910 /NCGR_PEP_ID=MMETSP1437-20131217/12682_1 /TAXON_ID=49252 ORGANISM="Eucampia antarctica, Strain CCMP1452" /NCGR_SAMPLE_ID=MMETSP1437 /ASSEMBLY_ACC=CAM_ASM_001096 /LENGTH=119 /DNA_ID=CAMNT_0043435039 /DNA_START=54 /DNA_END=413 /DNA_ORIENTATION=+